VARGLRRLWRWAGEKNVMSEQISTTQRIKERGSKRWKTGERKKRIAVTLSLPEIVYKPVNLVSAGKKWENRTPA